MNDSGAPAAQPPAVGGAQVIPGHPWTRFFHVLFKIAAGVLYLLASFLPVDFTVMFTVILVLVVADFWTVKNVSGRLLVGMRWWNDVSEAGEGWRFESLVEGQRDVNKQDKWWFWLALVVTPAFWSLFGFLSLIRLKLDWVLLCVIALVLSVSNLWGYFRCSREAKKLLKEYAQNAATTATQGVLQSTLQSALNKV